MTETPAERAYVLSRLDSMEDRREAVAASMQTDLDRLRDEWAESYGELRAAHEARVQKIQDDLRDWLSSRYADEADDPAQDVDQGRPDASALAGRRTQPPGVAGPGQLDPYAAELADAERIRNMDMRQYTVERARLGIRSDTDMSRLFGA
jgi:hypothetical protein